MLTKSDLASFRQCPRKLWLEHHRPDLIPQNDTTLWRRANDGNIVETTPVGAEFQPLSTEAGAGGLFGLTVAPTFRGVYFVNDANNTLGLMH